MEDPSLRCYTYYQETFNPRHEKVDTPANPIWKFSERANMSERNRLLRLLDEQPRYVSRIIQSNAASVGRNGILVYNTRR